MPKEIPSEKSLNLLQLKEQMEEIVFNYIDTSQKWELANSKIDELLKSVVHHFDHYVKATGELPKEDTYWVLFLNLSYKLVYFHALTDYYAKAGKNEADKNRTVEWLTLSANCIPNVHAKSHSEFLKEIAKSIERILELPGKQAEFEKSILQQNNRAGDCLKTFMQVTKNYLDATA